MSWIYVRLALVAVLVLALAAAGFLLYSRGEDNAFDQIEEQNDKAGDAAIGGAGGWRSCIDAGGGFDFASGKCSGT